MECKYWSLWSAGCCEWNVVAVCTTCHLTPPSLWRGKWTCLTCRSGARLWLRPPRLFSQVRERVWLGTWNVLCESILLLHNIVYLWSSTDRYSFFKSTRIIFPCFKGVLVKISVSIKILQVLLCFVLPLNEKLDACRCLCTLYVSCESEWQSTRRGIKQTVESWGTCVRVSPVFIECGCSQSCEARVVVEVPGVAGSVVSACVTVDCIADVCRLFASGYTRGQCCINCKVLRLKYHRLQRSHFLERSAP